MSRVIAALICVFLALSFTGPAFAATTGLVRGTITIDGKPAAGATVVLEGEGSLFKTTLTAKGSTSSRKYRSARTGSLRRQKESMKSRYWSTLPAVRSRRSTSRSRRSSKRSRRRP